MTLSLSELTRDASHLDTSDLLEQSRRTYIDWPKTLRRLLCVSTPPQDTEHGIVGSDYRAAFYPIRLRAAIASLRELLVSS